MKLSTRTRYGLKAVVDLAIGYGQGPLSLTVLAAKQGVSESYLEQLLRILKKEGIVDTVRGVNGGYILCEDPEMITASRVILALEGGTSVVDCVSADGEVCGNACTCSARPLFLRLQSGINEVLERTKISDLANDYIKQQRRMEDAKSIS
ncbi:MAG: Rrf2 family transcriptional regulator [Clostridia bacterium]|nr:Rrf2 family transcriptional regulator [Clostridia bacterium]